MEDGEYALIIGQDGESMSVRVERGELPGDDSAELPVPATLVAALAEPLLHDPDFHDKVLAWCEEHRSDEDGGEEGDNARGQG